MRNGRLRSGVALVITLTILTALAATPFAARGDGGADAGAKVGEIVTAMDGSPDPAEVFALSRELDDLGPEAVPAAKTAIASASPRATLGLARYLIAQKELGTAFAALERAIEGEDHQAAALAAELIELNAQSKDDVKGLKAILDRVTEPAVKIAVAKALRAKANDASALRVIKEYLESDDWNVRADAALALGDLGNVEAVKPILADLQSEPTERGKRAKQLLERENLYQAVKATMGLDRDKTIQFQEKKIKELEAKLHELKKKVDAGQAAGNPLLDEIMKDIRLYYVDESPKIEAKVLIDNAAKGMVASLDPFSSYMTEEETRQFEETMNQKYAGIGAVVSMDPKDKILTIIRPIYSGPAYEAGLRSLDKITEVEGESTFGKSVEELVSKLKGEPGTDVKIKVYRKGWQKERDYVLTRREISLESVHSVMLPGQIGYLALSQFGQNAEQEVEDALAALELSGMRALILDLRANPGGLLSAAVEISDKFLKDDKLIVWSEGRNPVIAPRREYKTREAATHPDYPIVILVNKASASASEIVAGALQDHKRAMLVGENTFGKGSVQQLMKLKATNEESTLRLTIAKYYLPSGRSIHRDETTGKGGVDPDIVVENESEPAWVIAEADKLFEVKPAAGAQGGAGAEGEPAPPDRDGDGKPKMGEGDDILSPIELYVRNLWRDHKDICTRLADFDAFEEAQDPGFDGWYASLGTKLDPEHVRKLVRNQLRRLVQDERKKEFAYDLAEDAQLQRGVFEVLKKLGDDPRTFREYAFFAEKFGQTAAVPGGEQEEPAEVR